MTEDPEKKRAYILYVTACERRNQGDEVGAMKAITEALVIRPKNALYVFSKGLIEWEFDHLNTAIASLSTTARMRPQWDDPIAALASIAYDAELYQVAKKLYQHAVGLKPNANKYTILANICLNEDPAEALRYSELALALEPDWEEAINLRADALKKLAERAEGDGR